MKRPPNCVDLGCMIASYALVAVIAVMVIRPDLFIAFVMECLP